MFAQLRRGQPSPVGVLRAYAECLAGLATSPAALARNLSYLQVDLTDPDFRKHLVKHARASRVELQRIIDEAIEAGELRRDTDSRQLARTVEAVVGGSMMAWAYYEEGTAARYMRHDLDAVLAPYEGRTRKTVGR
jgi:hypothetical protein